MSFFNSLMSCLLGLISLESGLIGTANAQTCPHATLHIETSQSVDETALCEAAEPWADQGFRVLIYLTDKTSGSEADWFNHLDFIEARAGFRDLSQADSFDLNGIAFAASTHSDAFWSVTVTYGERLYQTPLDTDRQLDQIKQEARQQIALGQPTEGVVTLITESYAMNNELSPTQTGAIALLFFGGLGGTTTILALRRRQQQQLQKHLERLKGFIATALTLGDSWLAGQDPETMLPYQLFASVGGIHYPEQIQQMQTWLQQCRRGLDEAFQTYQVLQENDPDRNLREQIAAWENLYLMLVGTQEPIQHLTDEALFNLLNPVSLAEEIGNDTVSQPIRQIRQEFQGQLFKVEFQVLHHNTVEIKGLFGYLYDMDALIRQLQTVATLAPQALADLKASYSELSPLISETVGWNRSRVLSHVDRLIQEVEALQQQGQFLTVVERCQATDTPLVLIKGALEAIAHCQTCIQAVQTWMQQGYPCETFSTHQNALNMLITHLKQEVEAGEFDRLPDAIQHLRNQASVLRHEVQKQVEQHERVDRELIQLSQRRDQYQIQYDNAYNTVLPNIRSLSSVHYEQAQPILQDTLDLFTQVTQEIAVIQKLNGMDEQKFMQAESQLRTVGQYLDRISAKLQQIERLYNQAHADHGQQQALQTSSIHTTSQYSAPRGGSQVHLSSSGGMSGSHSSSLPGHSSPSFGSASGKSSPTFSSSSHESHASPSAGQAGRQASGSESSSMPGSKSSSSGSQSGSKSGSSGGSSGSKSSSSSASKSSSRESSGSKSSSSGASKSSGGDSSHRSGGGSSNRSGKDGGSHRR